MHPDLRPEDFLFYATTLESLDLCDFCGLLCRDFKLDGRHLLDSPFYDPTLRFESTPALYIFSLAFREASQCVEPDSCIEIGQRNKSPVASLFQRGVA